MIQVFDKPPYIDPGDPAGPGILNRGVAYRTVYDRAALDVPGELAGIWEAQAAGDDCRVAPDLPVKVSIADERMASHRSARARTSRARSWCTRPRCCQR